MNPIQTIEIPIEGMDCMECTQHVRSALSSLGGVRNVEVLLSSEKAILQLDPTLVKMDAIHQAVKGAGYSVGVASGKSAERTATAADLSRRLLTALGIVFGAVILLVVAGEWLGLLDGLTRFVPFSVGAMLVLTAGAPIFANVLQAAWKRQIIAHTLMSIGALAALIVGEWTTAMVVILFMHIGSYTERLTTEGARRAVRELTDMAPQTARVEREGREVDTPISEVQVDDIVIVRPGEKIPVDGEVLHGQAALDQSSVTGESMPVEAGVGSHVIAATILKQGMLRIRTIAVGPHSTFGRVIQLVEQAEAHRAVVQQFADKFSGYYLPIVMGIAGLTYLFSRNPLATAAVLLVACSCTIALATPIAMLATIGANAKHGVLIKGGKYLETLARANVLLIDKTGTLTLGKPVVTDVLPFNGIDRKTLVSYAASADRYSEHPLADALRHIALEESVSLLEITHFESVPGIGVRARINGFEVAVGRRSILPGGRIPAEVEALGQQGKTILLVTKDGSLIGAIAASDTLRHEVPEALNQARQLGMQKIELLTGDNEQAAGSIASSVGLPYRAGLLPEDKIRIVKEYQSQGNIVVMVGDGINDAPALAQADIGIAMGAAGTDIAIESAHITLMRDDWNLIPHVIQTARRTMRVVRGNLGFTAVFNMVGLTLAAFGFLPPMLAAALQSIPDLGILGNSARLIRQPTGR